MIREMSDVANLWHRVIQEISDRSGEVQGNNFSTFNFLILSQMHKKGTE